MKQGYFRSLTFDYSVLDGCKQYLNSRSCYFDSFFFSRNVCVEERGIRVSERSFPCSFPLHHLADIEEK